MAKRGTPQWDDEDAYDRRGHNGGRGNNQRQSPPADDEDAVTQALLEAQTLQQEGRIDEAIELCEEIVATYGRPDARYYLAFLYQEEHLWDSAIENYIALLDNADYALSCYYSLGQCYRFKGDLQNAVHYYDEAVDRVNLDAMTRDEADQLIQLCHEAATAHYELHNVEAAETVYNALLGFLRSRGWQDCVAQVDRLVQENGLPPPSPSGRVRAAPPSSPPPAAPPAADTVNPSGFLTDQPPVVMPPARRPAASPGSSGVRPAPPAASPGSSGVRPMSPGSSGVRPMSPGSSGVRSAPPGSSGVRPMSPVPPMNPMPGALPGMGRLSAAPPPLPEPQRTQVMNAMRDIENYIAHGLYTAAIEECLRVIELAPQYLDVHQALAEIYVQQGKIDQAITKYAILIDTYLVNGRIDDAIATYRRILQLEPNNFNYRVRLINLLAQHGRGDEMLRERVAAAETFLRLGYPDRAIEQFEQALVAVPGDLALRQNYALALVRAGKINQGIGELQRILQMDPNNPLALARWQIVLCSGAGTLSGAGGLAHSAVRMMPGDGSQRVPALEVLTRLVRALRAEHQRGHEDVVREYLAAIETSPTNGDLRYALGVVYHSANRSQDALAAYQAAMHTPGLDVLCHVGAGLALLALNDASAATTAVRELEEASAAVRRAPFSPALWSARPRLDGEEGLAPDIEIAQLLARAYQRSNPNAAPNAASMPPGNSFGSGGLARASGGSLGDETYRAISEITARHPNDVAGALQEMVQLVRHYRSQRQLEQAVIVLNEIARNVPDDFSVRNELAGIHISRGLLDEGIGELRRVAEIHHRSGQIAEATQALQQIGELQWQMGEQETAMATLKQVLSLVPDDMATRMLYIQYCLERGQHKDAIDQQTILARFYYHSRRHNEAVAALQQLIALDKDNYEAYDLLGQMYMALGEYSQAQRVYRHLAKMNPNSTVARDHLAQIQEMLRARR